LPLAGTELAPFASADASIWVDVDVVIEYTISRSNELSLMERRVSESGGCLAVVL
jgi:hypothetical protein